MLIDYPGVCPNTHLSTILQAGTSTPLEAIRTWCLLKNTDSLLLRSRLSEYGTNPIFVHGTTKCFSFRSRTPLIRNNWDGDPSGYEENPDKWIFL